MTEPQGPTPRNIVVGQFVDPAKAEQARQLRREQTPAERTLWKHLITNKLAGLHFRRQQVIDGFIADFYCHSAGLVVELDGSSHDGRDEYDAVRDRIFAGRGLRVLRLRNDHVCDDLAGVLALILAEATRLKRET